VELSVENDNGIVIVTVKADRLDLNNANIFKRAMDPILANASAVVMDLGPVRFIDSSGIGALLSCLRKMNETQKPLLLASLQRSVRSTMELVRMHRVFEIYESRQEALRAARQAAPAL